MTYRFISLRETTSKRGNTAACAAYQTKDDRVFLHSGATPRCAHSRACARQARQHYTHCGVFAVPPQRFPCSLTTRCNVRKSGHSPILFNCALSLVGPLRSKSPRKATRIKPSIDLLRNGIADKKPRLVSALMASHLYHSHKLSPSVPSRNISPTSGSHRVAKNSGRRSPYRWPTWSPDLPLWKVVEIFTGDNQMVDASIAIPTGLQPRAYERSPDVVKSNGGKYLSRHSLQKVGSLVGEWSGSCINREASDRPGHAAVNKETRQHGE